ncbi:class I SAM-dependent methyltransferase [Acidovorax sp. SRB_24]|uniref:class I SAM-dependent methyltransferase n=1 Tax=Acidovorax sp. SRB_24 TaxID=1962700 RepID=UPI00145E93F2|nr:class I SAM-dependent methyltransferase [Acidovorax sp. SRB_24]NMM77593.1 SAM-dependent methyltransferase [Acidovorax sp. SRB_24]
MHHWFDSPPGRYLLEWEQARFDAAVADVFGYQSLQLGMPSLQGLRANRMPHRWLALGEMPPQPTLAGGTPHLLAHAVALPFADNSLDLLVLPHTLELSHDPHTALREIARVLVPEGRVVISGLNPASLWGLRQMRARWGQRLGSGTLYLPDTGQFIGPWRLRDWLQLLSFEVDEVQFGCYRPAVRTQKWLQRWAWVDSVGERCWPILGAAYFMVAIKRVHGMRLLEPAWRSTRPRAAATVPVANRATASPFIDRNFE